MPKYATEGEHAPYLWRHGEDGKWDVWYGEISREARGYVPKRKVVTVPSRKQAAHIAFLLEQARTAGYLSGIQEGSEHPESYR